MSWFGMHDGFDDEMQEAPDIFTRKPPTNADRIRAMTDEELASLLMYFADDTDGIDEKDYDAFGDMEWRKRILRWLKQEVTE